MLTEWNDDELASDEEEFVPGTCDSCGAYTTQLTEVNPYGFLCPGCEYALYETDDDEEP